MLEFLSPLLRFFSIAFSFLLVCADVTGQSTITETSSPVIFPANTPVILHLKESLYKKDAKRGYSLEFEVSDDVVVNGQIMIQRGTTVTGSVRQVDGKRPPKLLIDLGPAKTVSGEKVRLTSSSFSSNRESPTAEAVGMGSAAGPILAGLMIASLFQKSVLLDQDAWGGVWGVVRTVEEVTPEPVKQKAAQEQYIANQKAAQAERCKLWSSTQNTELIASLMRQGGPFVPDKASLLRQAGDLDGAIEVYQQLLESRPDLPCSDKYPQLLSTATLLFTVAGPEKRDQALNSFRTGLHIELAGSYREKRDFVHSISESRAAMQLDPENEHARIALINSLEDSGDLDAAAAESKEALRIWPDRSYFHYLLGRELVKKDDADAAIVELQWALEKERQHFSSANCELGRAFEQKRDSESAYRQYRTAFRAHVNDAQCRAAYERLKLLLKK
jgi:tetratricopeptide (TPR) repeat protein